MAALLPAAVACDQPLPGVASMYCIMVPLGRNGMTLSVRLSLDMTRLLHGGCCGVALVVIKIELPCSRAWPACTAPSSSRPTTAWSCTCASFRRWSASTFGDIRRRFDTAVVVGFMCKAGALKMNPPDEEEMPEGARLVALADNGAGTLATLQSYKL